MRAARTRRFERGTLDRCPDVGLRGEMEDELRPQLPGQLLEGLVADVELVELCPRGEVLAGACAEVVHDVDLVPPREQAIDQVRPDESASACDERLHRPGIVSVSTDGRASPLRRRYIHLNAASETGESWRTAGPPGGSLWLSTRPFS